jgi:hypothetical protein
MEIQSCFCKRQALMMGSAACHGKTQFDANLMQVVDSWHERGESDAALGHSRGHAPNDGSVGIVRDPLTAEFQNAIDELNEGADRKMVKIAIETSNYEIV